MVASLPPRSPAPGPGPRSRRSWPQRILITIGVLTVLACGVGAVGISYLLWRVNNLDSIELALADLDDGEARNFLFVGSDSRDGISADDPDAGLYLAEPTGGRRSDTIIVVRVDPAQIGVDMVSIPRDLWVPIEGTGRESRINSAYADGPQALVDTVQDYFDIEINHYIEADFRGFQGLVDALGGVPIWFPEPVRDRTLQFQVDGPACVNLDATQALAFARSRHLEYQQNGGWQSDPTGDLGRMGRQQLFLQRAFVRSQGLGLTDIATVNRLLNVASDNVTIDSTLGLNELAALAQRFADFSPQSMRTHALPVSGFRTSAGASVLALDQQAAADILGVFRGDEPRPLTADQILVAVSNSSGVPGQAGQVSSALVELGFRAGGLSNGPQRVRTAVLHGAGQEDAAGLVAEALGANPELILAENLAPRAIMVETGLDFVAVGEPAAPVSVPPTSAPLATTAAPTTVPLPAAPSVTVGYQLTPSPADTPCS
ncbi:MAG: LCP family protein [Actinomycetia bacterium]|nr:LCP family protein [Actinomycetes bacterium]